MFKVAIQSVAGVTAGGNWTITVVGTYLQRLLRDCGLPKYESYLDSDIGGLCFTSQILVQQGRLMFTNSTVSSSQKTHNRKLDKQRKQICRGPFEPYRGKSECKYCPMGKDQCVISRSAESFSKKRTCENHHVGFFRESEPDEAYCLGCILNGQFLKKKEE